MPAATTLFPPMTGQPILQSKNPNVSVCSDPVENNPNVNFQNFGKSNYVASVGTLDGVGSGRDKWKLVTITDGSSNTFAVSERDSVLGVAAIWPGQVLTGGANRFIAIWRPNVRYLGNRGATCCGEGGTTSQMPGEIPGRDPCLRLNVSSGHSGGVNAGMCDGSVRFISNNIETAPTAKGQPPLDPPATGATGCLPGKTNFLFQKLMFADDGFPLNDN